jgi:hypothetical protein
LPITSVYVLVEAMQDFAEKNVWRWSIKIWVSSIKIADR